MAVTVLIHEVRHPIESARAAALIAFITQHQELFRHDNGKWLIHFKGFALTIEPTFVEQIEVKTAR